MAVANAPTYRDRGKKKPRRVSEGFGSLQTDQYGKQPSMKQKTAPYVKGFGQNPPPTQPTQPPPGPTFTPEPVPQAAPPPGPMPTIQGTNDRISGIQGFQSSVGDWNAKLRTLAQQYGGAPQVIQFGFQAPDAKERIDPADPLYGQRFTVSEAAAFDADPNTPGIQADPNSQTATIGRNAAARSKAIGEAHVGRNTFRSGLRLGDLNESEMQKQREIAAAQEAYNAAIREYQNLWVTGQNQLGEVFRNALLTDINAANERPPEPSAPDPAPAPAAAEAVGSEQQPLDVSTVGGFMGPGTERPTGAGWQGNNVFQQTEGPRAGWWYRVILKGGKRFKQYTNGDTVPA